MQTVNQTFYVPIKKEDTRIIMNLEISIKDINCSIYIHPINTWICIEKIS